MEKLAVCRAGTVAVCSRPVCSVAVSNIGFVRCGLVYFGFLSLLWTTYCQGVYDKTINPNLGAEYVGKGLAKVIDNVDNVD